MASSKLGVNMTNDFEKGAVNDVQPKHQTFAGKFTRANTTKEKKTSP
jgi:hypothetical protein